LPFLVLGVNLVVDRFGQASGDRQWTAGEHRRLLGYDFIAPLKDGTTTSW
jgi:hypothetical protein